MYPLRSNASIFSQDAVDQIEEEVEGEREEGEVMAEASRGGIRSTASSCYIIPFMKTDWEG